MGVIAYENEATLVYPLGIIIVYNGGIANAPMERLASPGYILLPVNIDLDFISFLCDTNCFCPNAYQPYSIESVRNLPNGGCFQGIDITTTFRSQNNYCMVDNGFLIKDENINKTSFLETVLQPGSSFYLGLAFEKTNNRWQWVDGTPLGDYQPWALGTITDGSNKLTSVYMNPNQQWVTTNPAAGLYSVCQRTSPCDSAHYCP